MPNPYFQFKQFIVYQNKTAMKVCTDSCLFGAWAAHYLKTSKTQSDHILDIGAGTGLLSLLLAQKISKASIDAIEADAPSALQATENFMQSFWEERLHLFEGDVLNFQPEKKYDFIISNPPFYEHDVKSQNEAKNKAHHNAGITLKQLVGCIKRLLSDEGRFAVLLPYLRTKEFEAMANEEGYFLIQKTAVKQTKQHSFFRSMNVFSREEKGCEEDEMVIKDEHNNYTATFIQLLKDYYLYL